MTYLDFHLVFTVPPIMVLIVFLALRHRSVLASVAPGMALIIVAAVVYTTPWDNYLVYKKVWGYGSDRVLGTIGYVPVEEYAFFILQTILTGLLLTWAIALERTDALASSPSSVRLYGILGLVALSVVGAVSLYGDSTLYFGLITAWAAPVLLLQWILGFREIVAQARIWVPVVAVATLYLGVADFLAIRAGTWRISDQYSTGFSVFGLPIEEGLFFLATNLMVAWGLVLLRAFRLSRHTPDHQSA